MSPPLLRILVADHHALYRDALVTAIATFADMELTAVATDGREAFSLIVEQRPDVALVATRLPILSGFVVAERVAELRLPTAVLLAGDGPGGALSKDAPLAEIEAAIRAAAARRPIG
jgi:DNA-binding NarL/FixJ family response regulator